MEVLTDTRGVDFKPYLEGILKTIDGIWVKNLPSEARGANGIKGATAIRFTIAHDGRLAAMHLDASTHTDSLNRAAWGAIAGVGQFPPLPADFPGPSLELRIRFLVNQPKPTVTAQPDPATASAPK